MNKVETIVNQLCDFIPYVDSFYNEKNGIYPITVSYTHLTLPTKA